MRERPKAGQSAWIRPFLVMEAGFDHVAKLLRRSALLDVLDHLARLSVLLAAVVYVLEADDRARERRYRAWEIVRSSSGLTMSGGRIDALETLVQDGVSLARIELTGTHLAGARLAGGDLSDSDLRGADLTEADLRSANLAGAHLGGATLVRAKLDGATLVGAILQEDYKPPGQVTGSYAARFDDANLRGANLRQAYVGYAKWNGADLRGADLSTAIAVVQEALNRGCVNESTALPTDVDRPAPCGKPSSTDIRGSSTSRGAFETPMIDR
jgi:hypothetical protein